MQIVFKFSFAVVSLVLLLSSCEKPLEPVGYSNPVALQVEADGWKSIDTVISVDPQTFVQDTSVRLNEFHPDTLPNGNLVYVMTEYAPVFAGCETNGDPSICTQNKLRRFVDDNLDYPQWAKARGVQGTSIATFVIGKDGRIRDTGVERSMGDDIDKLVLQMVEQIPVWHPAFHKGQPVAIKYRLPVTFTLPEIE